MKTTAEVKLQKDKEEKEKLQFLAARLNNWDLTSLVDISKFDDVKKLKAKLKIDNVSALLKSSLATRSLKTSLTDYGNTPNTTMFRLCTESLRAFAFHNSNSFFCFNSDHTS